MIRDEHYIEGARWQMRNSLDRRLWGTSGGWPDAIGYGVVDDYGVITRTELYPRTETAVTLVDLGA